MMVPARNAATIVLSRPQEVGGFQVLLTRRPEQMRFLGGFYVFPGGAVHESDYAGQALARCRGMSDHQAHALLGGVHAPEVALGHWVAAVRELFEEVGVLLCETQAGQTVHVQDENTKQRLEQKRRAIVGRQMDIGSLLQSEDLYCDLSRVVYFDHWVTPDIYPMRFDTRFYMAAMPPHQHPLTRSEEVTDAVWLTPSEALRRNHRRDFPLIPPTTTVLQNLSRFASWESLRAEFGLG
jgi:8-oxo-dGTP pyrophosphatase MutT (NUDIX family)